MPIPSNEGFVQKKDGIATVPSLNSDCLVRILRQLADELFWSRIRCFRQVSTEHIFLR